MVAVFVTNRDDVGVTFKFAVFPGHRRIYRGSVTMIVPFSEVIRKAAMA